MRCLTHVRLRARVHVRTPISVALTRNKQNVANVRKVTDENVISTSPESPTDFAPFRKSVHGAL